MSVCNNVRHPYVCLKLLVVLALLIFTFIFKYMMVHLETYILMHQVLYEYINYIKQILSWDRGSVNIYVQVRNPIILYAVAFI